MYYPTEDTRLNIARGLVKGTSVRNIFGHQSNMTSGTFKACWELDAAYVYLASAEPLSVVSSVAGDTGVTIKIIGLDTNYEVLEEVVPLDGTDATTPVITNNSFLRVNDVVTIAGNATGNVTLTGSVTTSTTVARMDAGTGRNQSSIYTVPAGCSFFLERIDAFGVDSGAGSPQGEITSFRNFVQLSSGVVLRVAEVEYPGNMNIRRVSPFKYSEKTDIQLQSKTFTTHETSIFAEGILIKDNLG
jgi:hypothetical protein